MRRRLALTGLICSLWGCSGTQTPDCGVGQANEIGEVTFCVYRRSVVIEEGFNCPPEMVLYSELDMDLAACGPPGEDGGAREAVQQAKATSNWVVTEPAAPPTFTEVVAPLFAARCASCHQAGGPLLDLSDYTVASSNATAIADQVSAGTMPAWSVTNDGSCGRFSHTRALNAQERTAIADWVAGGAPQGPPLPLPMAPAFEADLDATVVNASLTAGEVRCFPLSMVGASRFDALRAVGTDGVDYLGLYAVPPPQQAEIQGLDAADTGAGFACPSFNTEFISGWLPGPTNLGMPNDGAVQIAANSLLVLRVGARETLTAPRIGFELDLGEGAASQRVVILDIEGLTLPAGRANAEALNEVPVATFLGGAAQIHAFWPSEKSRLRSLKVEALDANGPSRCLFERRAEVFRDWTAPAMPDAPIVLRADETLRLRCEFDTSNDNQTVHAGTLATDEACRVGIIVEDLP